MNNNLEALNNYLFEQIERLQDNQSNEELEKEIARSKAVTDVAKVIVANGQLALSAMKYVDEWHSMPGDDETVPAMLQSGKS